VAVYAAFDGDRVTDVRFSGRGCAISQASASMMTERLLGKSLKEAEAEIETFKDQMVGKKEFPELDDLVALKGVVKYPSRIKCAVLAWSAVYEG
jgi:nitrogen fixation NifU-like protein